MPIYGVLAIIIILLIVMVGLVAIAYVKWNSKMSDMRKGSTSEEVQGWHGADMVQVLSDYQLHKGGNKWR